MTTPPPQDRTDSTAQAPDLGAGNASAMANLRLQDELAAINSLTSGSTHKPISLDSHQPTKPQQYNQDGFLGALVDNVKYSGIQKTTKAVAQIADQIAGTNMASHVNIFDKPLPAAYKSSEWYGEQFASAAGQIAPFVALFAVTRGVSARLGIKAALQGTAEEGLLLSRNNLILTGQTTVAGFASSAIFTPNEGAKKNFTDFAAERLKTGTIGGLDMAAITAGTLSLKSVGASVAKDSPLIGALLRNGGVGAALAGFPTGAMSAQLQARLFEGRSATTEEMQQSALGMATVGFGLGALHGQATEGAIDRVNNPTVTDVVKGNVERGYQHFDNFMASINPLLQAEPRLAYAQAGGRVPLRSLAMESTLSDLRSNMMLRDGDEAPSTGAKGSTGSGGAGRAARDGRSTEAAARDLTKSDRAGDSKRPGGKPEYQTLQRALEEANLSEIADHVAGDKVLRSQRVVKTLGLGNDSPIVLELAPSKAFPDGGALKVTIAEGGWQNNWGERAFDAQLLSKVHEVELNGSHYAGSANVYVQELVDTASRYEPQVVDRFFGKVGEAGLEFGDQGPDIMKQVGISRKSGELVLIDYPSIDKAGTHETLRQITEGAARIEEGYEAENAAIKAGKNDVEQHDLEHIIDADAEALKNSALKDGAFTAREQELLQQLQQGIPPKEVLEFAAILDGQFTGKGMPDVKAAKPAFDALVRRAQRAGVLEKAGKQAKMGGASGQADDDSDF